MRKLASLASVPELEGLEEAERNKVVRQWQRAATKSWGGYLSYVAFSVFVALSITFLPQLLFPNLRSPNVRDWSTPFFLGVGVALSNILWTMVIVRRRRNLLHRVLEERRAAL